MTPLALDLTVGIIILLSTVVAYMRGIIKEMFTVVGLFMAAFIAYKLGHIFIPEFSSLFNVPESGVSDKADYVLWGLLSPKMAAMASSYGSTFATVLLVVLLLGRLFSHWVKEAGMEIVDKVLGAAFGFLRGFFVVFVFYVPFHFLIDSKDMPNWAKDSYSVAMFDKTFSWVSSGLNLEEMIEERSEGIVIKFDKLNPNNLTKEEKKEIISKTLEKLSEDEIKEPSEMLKAVKEAVNPSKDEAKKEREMRRASEAEKYRDEYTEKPEINSYSKSNEEDAFKEQRVTPDAFYDPNKKEDVTSDPYRETYGEF